LIFALNKKQTLLKIIKLILIVFILSINCNAQNFQLKVIGNNSLEEKIIDSLGYNSFVKNIKSIRIETNLLSQKLAEIGFVGNRIDTISKKNDSCYFAKFNLGEKIKFVHIYIGEKSRLNKLISLDLKKDSLIIPYLEIESFLNKTIQKIEQKGFGLAKIKLINLKQKNGFLKAELLLESDKERKLNSIILKYDPNYKTKFPDGCFKQIIKKYINKSFNQEVVKKINSDFEKFKFVSQIKYPEILFKRDSTQVYVYLEKRKSNLFDGFIGFSNTENNKLNFNGYLDLTLENTLQAGEQLLLFWKSDGLNQKTFNASIDFPYVFKSPIGLKAQINIFKQDSLFQNTKTAINLGYLIDYNTRIYLGYQTTESSAILNKINNTISDYKNTYLGLNFEYSKVDEVHTVFPMKTNLSVYFGNGKRELIDSKVKNNQYYVNLKLSHNFYLNNKNCFNINYHNYFLQSNTYLTNELIRFGGYRSIRGFLENSLQANLMSLVLTEYRYILSPDLYIHTILDYGYYQDKTINYKKNLASVGLGLGVKTKNGLLKIVIANGNQKDQEFNLSNSIIHLNYTVSF
jgi:hypothetical protein